MPFCFSNLIKKPNDNYDNYHSPDFPDHVGYGELAGLRELDWAIYDYTFDDDWKPSMPITGELEALLYSGLRYPPALALSRAYVEQIFKDQTPSREEFIQEYIYALKYCLSRQSVSGFFLAEVVKEQFIDLTPKEWQWVLKIDGEPPIVHWVSDDYFIYSASVSHFALSSDQITHLKNIGPFFTRRKS